jgi:hypothetical protein
MQVTKNKRYLQIAAAIFTTCAVLIILQGCGGPNDFNYGKVRNIIEGSPLRLDAEYVWLTAAQYECGVQEDLWQAPTGYSGLPGQIGTARVTRKGNDLKFSDDVTLGEKRYPYVQIRGDFSVAVNEITNDKAGPEEFTRLVETKVGAIINHSCFPNPLPIMGVRKGQFTQDFSPILMFRYRDGWSIDKVVHN